MTHFNRLLHKVGVFTDSRRFDGIFIQCVCVCACVCLFFFFFLFLSFCWTEVHFVRPLVPSVLDFGSLCPWLSNQGGSSSHALFCCLCSMIPRVISGCQDWALNRDRSPLKRTRYHCTNPTRQFIQCVWD